MLVVDVSEVWYGPLWPFMARCWVVVVVVVVVVKDGC